MTVSTTAPLDTLYRHAFNPRQSHDEADNRALAHSIFVNGLIQNLGGYTDPDHTGTGIVAGGRRLAALAYLRDNPAEFEGDSGTLPDFAAIPLTVTDDANLARSWAGTEAATQRPLHAADEIAYYAQLAATGTPPDQIARAYACTTQHVKRRLKLASLPAATLDALRADKITLEAAGHLTLCSTPEQHAAMLETIIRNPHQARWIKTDILKGRVEGDDYRAIFVGADLYAMEGGTVEEDLFSEMVVFADEVLLDRLFKEKLITAADRAKADHGYANVIPVIGETNVSWNHTQHMTILHRVSSELPEADAAELADLLERGNNEEELTDAEIDRMDELETRAIGSYRDEDIATGTAFVFVDRKGQLQTEGPYLPRAGTQTTTDGEGTVTQIPAKPPITQSGMDDLWAIQLLALQTAMIDKFELVLDLQAFQLAHDMYSHSGPFNVTTAAQNNTPSCTDEVRKDARLTLDTTHLTTSSIDAFTAFKGLGKPHRNKVLIAGLIRTLNRPHANPLNAALAEVLDASPRTVWTPTASHFKACSAPTLDAIWRELVIQPDEEGSQMEQFTSLKKAKKVEDLEALFNDTSFQEALGLSRAAVAAIDAWVPVVLRGDA